ncbi:MAG: 16S rRNA (uracil(1498)-N(3))-methyltransferase [Acholeplasmataceae bacterium]|nr:16S rRNA (uracil(1498)-N(3))-methyltransferase [Acholeplasmataceae bacterium]
MPQRYFLDQLNQSITGQDAHHIKKVMRMNDGDEIIVCANQKCYLASIKLDDASVSYQIICELDQPSTMNVTLIQGLPKGSKNEFVVKYATIFGASQIIFVPMQRSIAKLENIDNKLKRLSMIAKEAAELAHRFDVPKIQFEKSLNHIGFETFDLILLADENNKTLTIDQVLPKSIENIKILLIIGPEGGITDSERELLVNHQAISISLGHNIIPTEAACLYALSYISTKKT